MHETYPGGKPGFQVLHVKVLKRPCQAPEKTHGKLFMDPESDPEKRWGSASA
jgi:hypothetical protein